MGEVILRFFVEIFIQIFFRFLIGFVFLEVLATIGNAIKSFIFWVFIAFRKPFKFIQKENVYLDSFIGLIFVFALTISVYFYNKYS